MAALTDAQRKANERARKKGLPEPYGEQFKADQEAIKLREVEYVRLLEEVAALDKEGGRYKSEARSYTQLVRIFFGQPENGDADDKASESTTKKEKGPKRPNPSETRIQIRNSQIDPNESKPGKKKTRLEEISYELNDVVSFWRWLDLRDRARKDLFWLGRLLGKSLYRSVHQITCDQFVPKNFGGSWLTQDGLEDKTREPIEPMYFEGYDLDDFHAMIEAHQAWRDREMMLLDSRGFYKSTINGVDSVQWLLNAPDIRIFIITGKYDLSVKFLREIKRYFYLGKNQQPTAFQLLFPEYVLTGVDGTSQEPLDCPARVLVNSGKEHSLWVDSIVSNLSGDHCDIKKGDDVVTDKNSNTEETREEIKIKYDGTDNLLDPHGFMDHIGTRYFTDDWYGTRLATNPETGEVAPIKYHCRGCWIVKPEYSDVPLLKLTEEMVTLTFPQKWTFARLHAMLLKFGERYFKNQQLNEPTDAAEDSGFKVSFTESDMRAHMYQREAAPKAGEVFIVWDWALSDRKTSDYSVGVAARLYKNDANKWACVILEIIYDKWKYSELAFQIVKFSQKWNPKVTMIEASNGYDMIVDEISRVGSLIGYKPYVYAKQPSRQENAKRNRIKSLEILLSEHRLHFVLGPWIDETIKQFTQYTGEKKNKGRKDDIPDACSYLVYILPAGSRPTVGGTDPEEEKRLAEEQLKQWQRAAQYDRYFGQALKREGNEQASTYKQWLDWQRGGGSAPPATTPAEPPKPQDPRMKIFGNKGPWRL